MKNIIRLTAVGSLLAALMAMAPANAASASCDRSCLRKTLDQYLAAVLAHDPGKAPLALGFRQTENALAVAPGKGVWKSVTAMGKVQAHYVDDVNQSAGFYGTMREGEDGIIATLRLQVSDRRITEAEWIIARKDTGTPNANGLGSTSVEGAELSPAPERTLPKGQRASRSELIALANGYFDSLQSNDTSLFVAHPGWSRTENGIGTGEGPGGMGRGGGPPYQGRTGGAGGGPVVDAVNAARGRGAGAGAGAASSMPACGGICAVVARRYPVVDEEAGVVLGMVIFQRPPGNASRRNLLSEWFAVDGGKVHGIYAAMHYLAPTIAAPNWPPYEGNWPLSFAPPATAPAAP